jgi:hypothetical protein
MLAVSTYFSCAGQMGSFALGATVPMPGQPLEGGSSAVRADTRLR